MAQSSGKKYKFMYILISEIWQAHPGSEHCQAVCIHVTVTKVDKFQQSTASAKPETLSMDIRVSPLFLTSQFGFQEEQKKRAAITIAEGDAKAAELIATAFGTAGEGLIELRKLEAAEDIAHQLAQSPNIVYLPAGQQTLLSLPH